MRPLSEAERQTEDRVRRQDDVAFAQPGGMSTVSVLLTVAAVLGVLGLAAFCIAVNKLFDFVWGML